MSKDKKSYKKPAKLTRKQKAFAHYLIDNPKKSATQAALATYDTDKPRVATQIGVDNLAKPSLQAYLAKYDTTAQTILVDIMNNSSQLKDEPAHATIASNNAKDILNRLHGLPTARHEVQSTTVNLNLDLTGIEQG